MSFSHGLLETHRVAYFGQLTWFTIYHEEKNLTSVIERYRKEVDRVNGVLEGVLAKNNGWLTGEKCTVADLSFVIWIDVIVRNKSQYTR